MQYNKATLESYSTQQYFVPIRTILGVKLGTYCLQDEHYVAVKVGYDARYVFAYPALYKYGGGSIAMNGLYVNFIWDF